MSDIEDIMRHLNLRQDIAVSQTVVEQPITEEPPIVEEPQEEVTAQETSISDDEFNALIGDFSDPEDVVAASMDEYDRIAEEEVRQSEEGVNTEGSNRFEGFHSTPADAEVEELANAITAMVENEDSIHFHMPDGSQVDVPVLTEVRDLDAEEDADWDRAVTEGLIAPALTYVGSSQPSRVGDVSVNPETGEIQVLADTGTQTIGNTISEENLVSLDSNRDPIDPTADDSDDEEETQETSLIEENSPTLRVDVSTARFSGAQWYDEIKTKRIIIAGIGGIGSWTSLLIARLHPERMVLYDSDTVNEVNMAGQLYSYDDIGNSKVNSLERMIRRYTTLGEIYTIMDNYTDVCPAGDIMICGFDNMEARKTFFESWKSHVDATPKENRKNCLLLDGRLDMSNLQVFCLTGDDDYNINRYKDEFLFSDAEADQTVCSMKQTTYMACMIGSIITNLLVNFTANLTDPVLPYDLPFLTEYDAQNIIFKTTN